MKMINFRCLLFVLITLIVNSSLLAQSDSLKTENAGIEGSITIGYAQVDYKSLQNAIENGIKTLNFPAKIIDNFPNRPVYTFEISLIGNADIYVGLKYSFISTGSRISYADYSGEYKYDNILNCNNYGINFRFSTKSKRNLIRVDAVVGGGFVNGKLTATESITIAGQKQSQYNALEFNHYYIEPGIRIYYIWNNVVTGINATYDFNLKNITSIEWNGLRIGVLVGYRI